MDFLPPAKLNFGGPGIPLSRGGKLASLVKLIMTLDEAKNLIKTCAAQMDAHYGKIVFDEWAVVSLAENSVQITAPAISRSRGTAPARFLRRSWFWVRRFI
jgi:hypothetical protein